MRSRTHQAAALHTEELSHDATLLDAHDGASAKDPGWRDSQSNFPDLLLVRSSPSLVVDPSGFGLVLLELNAVCVLASADRGCVVVLLA